MSALTLPQELREWAVKIEKIAADHGLDFFPTVFEMVTYEQMNMLAAYEGFPIRYRHWKWGMEYERLSKSYAYGLSKIYELVINTDPCYAYLLEGNATLEQKLVMAHVFAHCDFFKNNAWFARTDRKMLDQMANHAAKIARVAERIGQDKVEDFIDTCLSIDNLIDIHSPYIVRRRPVPDEEELPPEARRLHTSRDYMDRYINPEAEMQAERERLKKAFEESKKRTPAEPERDVMLFLIEHAPLERWQRQILEIIREEAYYFAPQRMTKIMNEGWASYWHSKIMTTAVCDDSEIIDFASVHSGTMQMSPTQLNPYKIGLELYRDIEDRWNRGRFGLEYERCEDMETRANWDRQLGLGKEKIFEVRKVYNDLMFIDEFLTPEFAEAQKLFTFGYNRKSDKWEIKTREFLEVKQMLLKQLTNFGQPSIYVEDMNYKNRGELLLWHKFDGQDLKLDYGRDTLAQLAKLWSRPVHIRTVSDGKSVVWSHDGSRFEESRAAA
ncbi:MAG: SpoVR family protein [Deltaproteobacteria bacterium HGW-Deltaproteobacteria-14]|jgi:stage V sporulation protein R|nr:MAG: SpoVR family protein [Deltaproteobacteria bacterium HGW-Deltaproteobacteria-14]